jgi:protein-disulfide isomerase
MLCSRFALLAALLCCACSSAAQPAAQSAAQPGPQTTVATVGDTAINLAEVDEQALRQPAGSFGSLSLQQAIYEARRSALDVIIGDRLLDREAKARGIDRAALVAAEITKKVASPTEADITAWYQANLNRLQGAPIDQVRQPIASLLLEEKTQEARRQYLDTLRSKTAIAVTLEAPRVVVADAGRPARGPERAPVQIIEFSDFECPFCLRAYPTVVEILSTYGDSVRLVYRHFPLPNHPNARPAAEASSCAADQGKFWEFHDRLFSGPGRLSAADLRRHAAELGLDTAAFTSCIASGKHRATVEADLEAGETAGVSGTPAFFINGRPVSGAQPFEVFKRIIDEELAARR